VTLLITNTPIIAMSDFVHQFLSRSDFHGFDFMQYEQILIAAGCTSLEDISHVTAQDLHSLASIPLLKGLRIIRVAKQALQNKQKNRQPPSLVPATITKKKKTSLKQIREACKLVKQVREKKKPATQRNTLFSGKRGGFTKQLTNGTVITQLEGTSSQGTQIDKPYSCKCGRKFKSSQGLASHKRTHARSGSTNLITSMFIACRPEVEIRHVVDKLVQSVVFDAEKEKIQEQEEGKYLSEGERASRIWKHCS